MSILERYTPTSDPFYVQGSSGTNLSSITWNPDTSTYFVLFDSPQAIMEFEPDLRTKLREIGLDSGGNYEGLAYLGSDEFAVVNEENVLLIDTIGADTATIGEGGQWLVFSEPPTFNLGAEGVAYDPTAGQNGRFWVVQEKKPMRLYQFDRPMDGADHSHDVDLEVIEPFHPVDTFCVWDLSDVVFDARTGRLIVASHESARLLDVDPATGEVGGELALRPEINGFPSQWEAVALGPNGDLVVGSEAAGDADNRAQMWAYSR